MKCMKCGAENIPEEYVYNYLGKTLCEDCYIDIQHRPQPCDPGAVYSARKTREMLGQTGTDGLSELQKDIYNFIKEKEKVTHQEIADHFKVELPELQKQFAILRHCELVKGCKEGNTIYLMIMN